MIGYIYSYGLSLVSHSIVTRVLRLQTNVNLLQYKVTTSPTDCYHFLHVLAFSKYLKLPLGSRQY
jgi:hypothetical protein